jgi:hypothetical protein
MARVEFTPQEWAAFVRQNNGDDARSAYRWYRRMEAAQRRQAHGLMDELAEYLQAPDEVRGLFARDGQVVLDPWDAEHLVDYIGMGDTYDATLLYNPQRDFFFLGTYGGIIEAWEQEHQLEAPEGMTRCEGCGDDVPFDEIEDTLCSRCATKQRRSIDLPTWVPHHTDALVAVLKSVEGNAVDVRALEGDPANLAFSVRMGEHEYSAKEPGVPYRVSLTQLHERFARSDSTAVATFLHNDVVIEREQYNRLRVALDYFMENLKAFPAMLEVPDALWPCSRLRVDWWQERGRAVVTAYGSRHDGEEYAIWAASDEEVQQLIDDGFIRWNRDADVRRYLLENMLCK